MRRKSTQCWGWSATFSQRMLYTLRCLSSSARLPGGRGEGWHRQESCWLKGSGLPEASGCTRAVPQPCIPFVLAVPTPGCFHARPDKTGAHAAICKGQLNATDIDNIRGSRNLVAIQDQGPVWTRFEFQSPSSTFNGTMQICKYVMRPMADTRLCAVAGATCEPHEWAWSA